MRIGDKKIVSSDIFPNTQRGTWATYDMLSVAEGIEPPLSTVTIKFLDIENANTELLYVWEAVMEKRDKSFFAIKVYSNWIPLTSLDTKTPKIERYMLIDTNGIAVEYIDKTTGKALLPNFDFLKNFIPNPARNRYQIDGFDVTGSLIGHCLSLNKTGNKAQSVFTDQIKPLAIRSDLIVGTWGNAKDDGTGKNEKGDYTYIPFSEPDYKLLLSLGTNLFHIGDDNQEKCIIYEPVYFIKHPTAKDISAYPEIFYRSTYQGVMNFVDEPAVRMGKDIKYLDLIKYPQVGAELLRMRVQYKYLIAQDSGRFLTSLAFTKAGCNLGAMTLFQSEMPIWETLCATGFLQVQAGSDGIIEEGRYNLKNTRHTLVLGDNLKITAEELVKIHHAFLRGPARCFNTDWGMAIYGQADPQISPIAMTSAYDMGARYIWFWTWDHDHHLPWEQAIKLTKHLNEYTDGKPFRNRQTMSKGAKAAIVMPEGFLPFNPTGMWFSAQLTWDKLNFLGIPNKDIIAPMFHSAISLIRDGIDFDFVIDSPEVDKAGYEELIRINYYGEAIRVKK